MSYFDCSDPIPGEPQTVDAIDTIIIPRARDLGGLEVRRVLPSTDHQMVGPFIFFDQMGPAEFVLGEGLDVRPHPHINLATLTYLFGGEVLHRDSLGTEQVIRPGAVNLMTAGEGIVHSERMDETYKERGAELFGLQTWLALPRDKEEMAPSFVHQAADDLPLIEDGKAHARLVVGSAWGERSPVPTYSDTVFADVTLPPKGRIPIDAQHEERAIYPIAGSVTIGGEDFDPGQLLILRPGEALTVTNPGTVEAHFVLVGGATMDSRRHIWWNFVSSRQERIEQAKAEWKAGRFDTVPGDEEEFIPLP
jgi:redox-sensitive bicupin YhaK (pirin superfamily)